MTGALVEPSAVFPAAGEVVSEAGDKGKVIGLGEPLLDITVIGGPVGQGNLRHLGKGRPAVHQNADRLKPWRLLVQHAAQDALGVWQPVDAPLVMHVTFTVAKPKSAPKTRRTWPMSRPDLDHLVRAVGDALGPQGASVYRDDARLVEITARKSFPREHPDALHVPGARIRIWLMEGTA